MTLSNSTVAYSWNTGVTIGGFYNTVTQCTIHDVDYDGYSNVSGICLNSGGHTITHNTLHTSGRDLIRLCVQGPGPTFPANTIEYNDLSNCGLQTADVGAYYANPSMEHFESGDEVAYNSIHDINCGLPRPQPMPYPTMFGQGIYPDSDLGGSSHGFRIHHNCVWNCGGNGIIVNNKEYDMQVYNNTVWDKKAGCIAVGAHTSNVKIINNLYSTPPSYKDSNISVLPNDPDSKLVVSNNVLITDATIGNFANVVAGIYTNLKPFDFRLKSSANLPPNVGAFPYGSTPWTVGASGE